jgi:tetratricopeptide (TPR) repeat protein
MARADRRRTKRARQTAGIRASGGAGAVEQTLFFTKLRRSAKWIFAALALVFGLSFVVFGVGSEVPGGVADILQGRSPQAGPSVEEAQERVDENPRDAEALRELATALQQDGRSDEAIPVLERYSQLRPRDADGLRQLAALHLTTAAQLRNEVQEAQMRAAELSPGSDFTLPTSTPLGQALADRPILNAVQQTAQEALADEFQQLQEVYRDALRVYQRLVVLEPEDATLQLQLAEAAEQAGDTAAALAAYRRFLELAPDDSRVPLVKQQVDRLEASGPVTSGG